MGRMCNLVLALILTLSLVSCGQSIEASWQEQYDLGVRYLSEGNYEEAIIAFTAAIEIDPKRPDAYSGLSDAYIAVGDMDSALAALKQGYEITEDQSLAEILEDSQASAESAFHKRIGYVPFEMLDAVYQEYIQNLATAAIEEDRNLVWDLLLGESSVSNWINDYSSYGRIYTEWGEFRLRLSPYSGNSLGSGFELRPKNGHGYYYSATLSQDPAVPGGYKRSAGIGKCENWNWNGTYQFYVESSTGWNETTRTETGEMVNGLLDGVVQIKGSQTFWEDSYGTPAGTVRPIDFTVEYDEGVRLDGLGTEGRLYGLFNASYDANDIDGLLWND